MPTFTDLPAVQGALTPHPSAPSPPLSFGRTLTPLPSFAPLSLPRFTLPTGQRYHLSTKGATLHGPACCPRGTAGQGGASFHSRVIWAGGLEVVGEGVGRQGVNRMWMGGQGGASINIGVVRAGAKEGGEEGRGLEGA